MGRSRRRISSELRPVHRIGLPRRRLRCGRLEMAKQRAMERDAIRIQHHPASIDSEHWRHSLSLPFLCRGRVSSTRLVA